MSAYFYPQPYLHTFGPSARDRYLEAIAQAEAAKAEYEASIAREAEMARRQQARDAYILQEQFDNYYNYQPIGNHRPCSRNPFNSYHYYVDPQQQQLEYNQRHHARLVMEERARIRAEAEAAAKAKARRESEARKLAALKAQQSRQALQSQQRVSPEVTLEQILSQIFGHSQHAGQSSPAADCPRKSTECESKCLPQACQSSCASINNCCVKPTSSEPSPKSSEECPASQPLGLEQFFNLLIGAPVKLTNAASQPTQEHCSTQAAAPVEASAPSASSSTFKSAPVPSQTIPNLLKDVLANRLSSEPESDVRDAIQGLVSSILSHQRPQASCINQRTPSPKPERSLKEQLEGRLHRNQDAEARDVELAIAESLKVVPPSPSLNKGKSAAVAESWQPSSPAASLAVINDIEAQFKSLASSFEFPSKLDISPPSSPGAHSTSTLSRLAFTAANAPVRYYEQALSGLLSRLDAIESSGDEVVRHRRKEVVTAVENALEEVEKEVETRAAIVNARDSTRVVSVPIIAEPIAPKQVQVVVDETETNVSESVSEPAATSTDRHQDELATPSAETVKSSKDESEDVGVNVSDNVDGTNSNQELHIDNDHLSELEKSHLPSADDQETNLISNAEPKIPSHTNIEDEAVLVGDGSDWSDVEA